jgi:hypothetical protein
VLIQELLRQALSLTVDSPESQLIAFLDMTAQLKLVDTKALTAMSHDEVSYTPGGGFEQSAIRESKSQNRCDEVRAEFVCFL